MCLAGANKNYTENCDQPKNKIDLLAQVQKVKSEVQKKVASQSISENDEYKMKPVTFVSDFVQNLFIAAWLTYFADDLQQTLTFLDNIETKVKEFDAKLTLENVYKLKLDILRFDTHDKSLTFSLGRKILSDILIDFPNNLYFLSCLEVFHVQPNAIDSTWRKLSSHLTKSELKTSNSLISAIKLLINQFTQNADSDEIDVSANAYLHRAKAMLETFVSRGPGRYTPLVWRLYMWTMHKLNGDVNTIFYRALQDCPVVKGLVLDIIRYLHLEDGDEDQLLKLLDILVEKEGRVRMPMEELDVLLEKEKDEDQVLD